MSFIADFIPFANSLADKSGEILRRYYRNFGKVITKEDQSPVTIADQETESALRKLIEAKYPEHGIIGEEHGRIREHAEYVWVIDPIDGTASFVIGRPIFGTLIALLHNGEPVLGLMDQPITKERWVAAKGAGCLFSGSSAHVRSCDILKKAVLCTTGPQYFNEGEEKQFDKIAAHAKQVVYGGDCYNYALLASGHVDAVVEAGLKLHDFAALKVLVEEAGGVITDWHGKTLNAESDGSVIACGSKTVHGEILALLQH